MTAFAVCERQAAQAGFSRGCRSGFCAASTRPAPEPSRKDGPWNGSWNGRSLAVPWGPGSDGRREGGRDVKKRFRLYHEERTVYSRDHAGFSPPDTAGGAAWRASRRTRFGPRKGSCARVVSRSSTLPLSRGFCPPEICPRSTTVWNIPPRTFVRDIPKGAVAEGRGTGCPPPFPVSSRKSPSP